MEVGGWLHDRAALPPGREPPQHPLDGGFGGSSKQVWA